MHKNIGKADRLLRLAIAIVLLFLAYWKGSWILWAAGVLFLFEAAVSWCVLYQILVRNCCPIK